MKRQRYECIVCGRVFPQGQGVVIVRSGLVLTFHSKACLTKFFKLFVERIDEKEFRKAAREVIKEYEKLRRTKLKPKEI